MGRKVTTTHDQLGALIEKDVADLKSRIEAAIDETGEDSVGIVWGRVPFAFGELHGSIHYDPSRRELIADAPHAAAVEVGSVPHMPPAEPLIAWAAMRGMADPESAGWGIAIKISKEGTRPHWYMRGSLPAIRAKLDQNIKKALAASGQGTTAGATAAKRSAKSRAKRTP